MKIELHNVEKYGIDGSGLRGMIMNKDMPIIDLLVRESIQNSLDAKDDSCRARFVNVDYTVGDFDRDALDRELEGVSLSERPQWGSRFLAVRDSNTVGLTGDIKNKKSNLYKLVYGIMKAQQASGAGGSWGIGKTVYFRVGVGLVIYYSRVKDGDGFSELLAAAMVEDETSPDAILPEVDGEKNGVAWWGDMIPGKESVKETRDVPTIRRVLDAFGIKPYDGTTTGTVIIIPFINEPALLASNRSVEDDSVSAPYWTHDVTEFIKISVQKWYCARLGNQKYRFGKRLNVSINGKPMDPGRMDPFFKLCQALYNKASLKIAGDPDADEVRFNDVDIICQDISINKQLESGVAGYVAYAKVTNTQLGICVPTYFPTPYQYIHSVMDDDTYGKPVIMYCRKPGMIVSHETDSKWTSGIPKTGDGEFIIGFFVLNSEDKLLDTGGKDLSLEEYVRKSELADHTSWSDYDIGNRTPNLITRIKSNVARKVASSFDKPSNDQDKTTDTGLSSLLGKLLLPPEGFGKKASTDPKPDSPGTNTSHKNVRFNYYVTRFTSDGLELYLRARTTKKKAESFGFDLQVDSVSGRISPQAWEKEVGLALPFSIRGMKVTQKKLDGSSTVVGTEIPADGDAALGTFTVDKNLTKAGEWFGVVFSSADGEEHSFEYEFLIDVSLNRRDIKPVLFFDI